MGTKIFSRGFLKIFLSVLAPPPSAAGAVLVNQILAAQIFTADHHSELRSISLWRVMAQSTKLKRPPSENILLSSIYGGFYVDSLAQGGIDIGISWS